MVGMEANPYRAPVDGSNDPQAMRTKAVLPLGAGAAIGILLVVTLAIAAVTAIQRIDIRENGPYWDEIERREKMGMTHEEPVRSFGEEKRRKRPP